MKINLRELEYFVAVAEQRHFGRAARKVRVSQPTLSMQLKKMEERLGGALIERLPRDAILTPLGAEVLPIARELLRLSADFEARFSDEKSNRLRLGVIPTIAPYLLPRVNRSIGKVLQNRKLSLMEAQTAELARSVKEGVLDIAILSTPLKERGLEEIEIYTEPFYVAVASSHPLADRQQISLKDLKNEKLLLLSEGHCLRNQALSLCKFSQSGDDSDLSATSIETLRSMVAMEAGVTLVPKLAIRKGEGVAYIPFAEHTTSRRIGLVYRPSYGEADLIETLVEILRRAAEREGLETSARTGEG